MTISGPTFRYLRKPALLCLTLIGFGLGFFLLPDFVSGQSPIEPLPRLAPIPVSEAAPESEENSDGIGLSALEHPWGRFVPKSWCCMQTVIWTNQEGHRIGSFRETRTTLESIEKDGLTLKESSTIDMAGKRVEVPPVKRRFDFFQESLQDGVEIRSGEPEKLTINLVYNSFVVPCEVRIYEHAESAGLRTTTVWYSRQVYPHVLQVVRVLRSLPTDKEPEERILEQSVTKVVESDAFQLRKSRVGTYRLRTTQKSGSITKVSESFCSRHIPGGIVHATTREFDRKGNEIRTVETRLINYFCMPPQPEIPPDPALLTPGDPAFFFDAIPVRPRWRRFYPIQPYFYY